MQTDSVDILLRQAETQNEGLYAVMSMCDTISKSQKQYIETIKLLRQACDDKDKRIRELELKLSQLSNSPTTIPIPIDNQSDKRLFNALVKIKAYVRNFSDWYFIERICYEKRLINFARINDHIAFVNKLNEWGINVHNSKHALNANHISKGAKIDDSSLYPNWKLKDGTACPDNKLSLVRRFLSFFPDEKE